MSIEDLVTLDSLSFEFTCEWIESPDYCDGRELVTYDDLAMYCAGGEL